MKRWTRQWWLYKQRKCVSCHGSSRHHRIISEAREPKRSNATRLIENLPMLSYDEAVDQIVSVYISHRLMPGKAMGDAAHLALASYHKCDFLITWNCRNIANANKFNHIRRVNGMLGLFTPKLVTPLQLLEGDYDEQEC